MRTNQNKPFNTTSDLALSIMAGWTPGYRSLEAEAAEMADMAERDTAARVTFQRRAGGRHHG